MRREYRDQDRHLHFEGGPQSVLYKQEALASQQEEALEGQAQRDRCWKKE